MERLAQVVEKLGILGRTHWIVQSQGVSTMMKGR